MTQDISIKGMICNGCVKNLTQTLMKHYAIDTTKVKITPEQVRISYKPTDINKEYIISLIEESGFETN